MTLISAHYYADTYNLLLSFQGYAGIGLSLLIVTISFTIALATVMSAVGICDRCHVRHGGVYFIVSHVLGGKTGGSVGLLYCLGHVSQVVFDSMPFTLH